MKPTYDIFISYRRDGGQATALLLYQTLVRAGYRVAYDLETLRSGPFPDALTRIIEHCKDVLVVLGPGALDRCADPNDWVRQEVACAFRANCNVVPILLRNFAFPESFDAFPDIAPLRLQNGVEASMSHFNDTVLHIRKLLRSRPRRSLKPFVLAAGAAALGAAVIAGILLFRNPAAPEPGPAPAAFPSSNAERQALQSAIGVSGRILAIHDGITETQLSLVQSALDNPDAPVGPEADRASGLLAKLERDLRDNLPGESTVALLHGTPLSPEIFQGVGLCALESIRLAQQMVSNVKDHLGAVSGNSSSRSEFLRAYLDLVKGQADFFSLVVMELMLPVPEDAPDFRDFRITAAKASSLPRFGRDWVRTQEGVDIEMEGAMTRQEKAVARMERLVGALNLEAAGAPQP